MKRVYLWEPGKPEIHLPTLRLAARALTLFAVNGKKGRAPPDLVHEWVTEGRRTQWERAFARGDKWAVDMVPYSSCGDLPHWLLMLLGCRDELVVNRGDDGGVVDWKPGPNISRLVLSKFYVTEGEPEDGDPLHVQYPDHMCVLTDKVSAGKWLTGDYGGPYANLMPCPVSRGSGGTKVVRGRALKGWVSLSKMLDLNAFTQSAWVPDDFPLGVADDNPYDEDLRIPPGV
jgi:hypothetical protein